MTRKEALDVLGIVNRAAAALYREGGGAEEGAEEAKARLLFALERICDLGNLRETSSEVITAADTGECSRERAIVATFRRRDP